MPIRSCPLKTVFETPFVTDLVFGSMQLAPLQTTCMHFKDARDGGKDRLQACLTTGAPAQRALHETLLTGASRREWRPDYPRLDRLTNPVGDMLCTVDAGIVPRAATGCRGEI